MSRAKYVRLLSCGRQTYAGRVLRSGDEFQASEAEAERLVAAHLALRDTGAIHLRGRYLRRDLRAKP